MHREFKFSSRLDLELEAIPEDPGWKGPTVHLQTKSWGWESWDQVNLSHIRWGDGTNGGEMSLFWGGGEKREEESILCSRAGEKSAQWEMFTRFVSRKRFWGNLKNWFQLRSGGRSRRQAPLIGSQRTSVCRLIFLVASLNITTRIHSTCLSLLHAYMSLP